MEIERKFLVNEMPGKAIIGNGWPILQGYLYSREDAELRVRRLGESHFLTSKNGQGRQRRETEAAISPKQFDLLWSVTTGRRLEKERHRINLGCGLQAELDIFKGTLDGLRLVEVEFPNLREAARFEIPPWFGPEVTDDPQFANPSLACLSSENLPEELQYVLGETRHSVGSIPVIQLKGINHFVVISTRNNLRWIFPKGNPEAGVTNEAMAAQEALEEAGAEGELFGPPIPVHYWRGYIHYIIDYYPMLVSTLHAQWEEKEMRQRKVCTQEQAAQLLDDSGFIQAMKRSLYQIHRR